MSSEPLTGRKGIPDMIYEMYGQADSHVVVIVENNNVGETNPRNNWSARN